MTNDIDQMEATMSTPFGPQLIGETKKTLNALLLRYEVQAAGYTFLLTDRYPRL